MAGAAVPSVGLQAADDAAVVQVGETQLVLTTDFFTPIVDSASDWGAIAAANAFSDVYAMGGTPAFALNLVAWPRDELPTSLLAEVLLGASEVAAEAGVAIVGGHTIDDPIPKYGLAVIGTLDTGPALRLDSAEPGLDLILTKPIGTGVLTTAHKAGECPEDQLRSAVLSMRTLNRDAANHVRTSGARAVTDVTGFGLLGHALRMARASGIGIRIDSASVPLLAGASDLADRGFVPSGTVRNLEAVEQSLESSLQRNLLLVLADAQTSGGLLAAIPSGADTVYPVIGQTTDRPGVLEVV